MKERRSLAEGLKTDPELKQLEESFVFGAKRKPELVESTESPVVEQPIEPVQETQPAHVMPQQQTQQKILPQMVGRIPVTVRCRPELASALKRVSLQRQLDGVSPYQVQEILEEAIRNWMNQNGYPAA